MDCLITKTTDTKFRADGSLSFFKGAIEFDGCETAISMSSKLTDAGHEAFGISDGRITLTDTQVAAISQRAASIAVLVAHDARHASYIAALPAIDAVSDRQRALAEDRRKHAVNAVLDYLAEIAASASANRTIVDALHEIIRSEAAARFWIELSGRDGDGVRALGRLARQRAQALAA